MIRNTTPDDADAILAIVVASGQFDADALDHVRQSLDAYLADGDSGGIWLTADDGEVVGVATCAPEPVTSGTWNLLMMWTRGDRHGRGHGSALVAHLEHRLREQAARLLIVETSALPDFAPARAFYAKAGFEHEATIRNFFAAGDHKIVLSKSLVGEVAAFPELALERVPTEGFVRDGIVKQLFVKLWTIASSDWPGETYRKNDWRLLDDALFAPRRDAGQKQQLVDGVAKLWATARACPSYADDDWRALRTLIQTPQHDERGL